jgi:hypothetical protein
MANRKSPIIKPEIIKDTENEETPTSFSEPQGIDYKEKFTYGNMMSELLALVGYSINRGGSGETELNTVWAYLLPELREELEVYRDNQIIELRNELKLIPDGLVYYNEGNSSWEGVGNDNNKVLNMKELLNPINRGKAQSMIFNSNANHRIIRQSGALKFELVQSFVLDMIPQIIVTLQDHNLLMQTTKKTVTGGYVLRKPDEIEENGK